MEALINNLQVWLRRNEPGDPPETLREPRERERLWFTVSQKRWPTKRMDDG